MRRREFLKYTGAALGSAAAGPLTTGCSGSGGSGLSLLLNHTAIEVKRFQHVVNDFQAKNSGITVNVQNIPTAAFYTKLNTEGVGHTLPDVWYVRTFDVAYDAVKKWTAPLDPYIAKERSFKENDFWPALQKQIRYQGKIYTLPWNLSDMVVYVNRSIFDEAGVSVPSPDWTWDDFANTAAKIPFKKQAHGRQNRYGCDVGTLTATGEWTLEGVLEANGGGLISSDFQRSTATASENADLLEFFVDMHKHHLMPTPGAFPTGVDPFVAGLVAMSVNGSWVIGEYPDEIGSHFKWEVLPLPKGSTGKRGVAVAGGGFGVSAFSKNKKAAFKLAAFLTNTASLNYVVSKYLDSLPARQSSMPAFLKAAGSSSYAPKGIENVQMETKEALPIAYPPYVIPLNTAISNRLGSIYTGSPVKKQLESLDKDIDGMIKTYYH